ncbi:DUF72 domain-containing protein [Mycetocola zhadangensis]|uniref:DUF72 domain-containing protein n=1 Tax=Mycetocola zhadangensis TaxID=1164595 RepID=A0A3L7J7K9_9MICO|nr:DUF72 domain-containing protein [Mycetocola zhadangensis]RLQ86335.1 DUF72 domain-containing protein [Mycetocola zhadangensis]GGE90278.1 hypothetical protein GCM10011313_11480 [Mycetocola zhadangensis]
MSVDAAELAPVDPGQSGIGAARIGISGWRYVPWRSVFYPKGLPQRRELEYVSGRMNSVEINGSFYALQTPTSYQRWADEVPDDFLFSVKGGRYITHILRLKDTEKALANFFASGVLALGPKLGPVLWQVPPNLAYDRDTLDAFLATLPCTTSAAVEVGRNHDERMDGRAWLKTDADRPLRHTLEIRHPSFECEDFVQLARDRDVAIVVSDSAGRFPQMFEVTSDEMYVRLHGAEELYVSGYPEDLLQTWAARVHGWRTGESTDGRARDVYVYCDNDAKVRAPFDAMRLAEIVAELAA